jgi:type III pantothenate kinase
MQPAIFWGYVGMVEGLLTRIQAEFGGPLKVIATGGLAPLFAEGTTVIQHTEPDITLNGRRLLAARNPPPIFHKTTLPDSLKNENE